jgi:hypothetical protein
MKKTLLLVCVLFFGIQLNAFAAEIETVTIKAPHGNAKMTITVGDPIGPENPKPHPNNARVGGGEIGGPAPPAGQIDTRLCLKVGDEEFVITKVPDGTIIETEGSDCRWYYIANKWFRVCD